MRNARTGFLPAPSAALILTLLSACGEDDGEGGAPDLFLGLSGVIIFILVVWGIARVLKKRG